MADFLSFGFLKSIYLQDIIEIIVITTIIYYFSLWLEKDKKNNLIFYFYGYCFTAFISYYLYLPTLTLILFAMSPVVILLFIIMHQEILQKNFVMLKKISTKKYHNNWINELIKSCLISINKNKEVIFVIEQSDELDVVLESKNKFYTNLDTEIFELLLEKHFCNNNYFMWITYEGKIVAINSFLKDNHKELINNSVEAKDNEKIPDWKKNGIFITKKTDAIIIKVTPKTRSFDIIIKGQIAENLNSDQISRIITSNINKDTDKRYSAKLNKFKQYFNNQMHN